MAEEGEGESGSKRNPESSSIDLLADLSLGSDTQQGKRRPEYKCLEDEAIGENFLTDPEVAVVGSGEPAAAPVTSDGIELLHQGTALLKYTRRNGIPHFRYVQLSSDNSYLRWFSKKKKKPASSIQINKIQQIVRGQQTEVFARSKQPQLEVASFSIIYNNDETFDCVAKGQDECTLWVETLTKLIQECQAGKDLSTIQKIPISINYIDRYRVGNRKQILSTAITKANLPLFVKKQLLGDIKKSKTKLEKIQKLLSKQKKLTSHMDISNMLDMISELQKRIIDVENLVGGKTSEKISRSDVWRLNVDMDCILEKTEVLAKEL